MFACGRYEGIDQRVLDHAATRMRVREVSLGDYVLNGGEAAALVVTEAVVRLLPGFMGNAASLVEESHEDDGLLEYPVYTKPASWRGLDVPDGAARRATTRGSRRGGTSRPLRRTAERRPDLLHPSRLLDGRRHGARAPHRDARPTRGSCSPCSWACWVQRGARNHRGAIPALLEDIDDVRAWIGAGPPSSAQCGPARRCRAGAPRRRRVGHRPADGGAGPARTRPGAGGCSQARGAAPRRTAHDVRAVHRRRQPAQPADVPAGRLPARAASSPSRASRS